MLNYYHNNYNHNYNTTNNNIYDNNNSKIINNYNALTAQVFGFFKLHVYFEKKLKRVAPVASPPETSS